MALGMGKGGKAPLSQQNTVLHALRVQTSAYGQTPSLVFGRNRVSGKLLWYGDFKPIAHTSQQNVGGKGMGGGKSVANTTYTYQAAVAIALALGTIGQLRNVWDTKGQLTLVSTTENITIAGSAHTAAPPGSGVFYSDDGVGKLTAYSIPTNDYGSDGPVTLAGNYHVPMRRVSVVANPGEYSINPTTGAYAFHAADNGSTVAITYTYSVPDSSGTGQPATEYALTLFNGAQGQSPWGYLTSNHSGQDIGYSGIAYVACANMDCGSSATLPNLTYEVDGLSPYGAGIVDAVPDDVIKFITTDKQNGAGMDPTLLADLSAYRNYCIAAGFFISPVYESQQAARDIVAQICKLTNSAAVWHDGSALAIIPYADTTVIGNGASYLPNTTPVYDILPTDMIPYSPGVLVDWACADQKDRTNVQMLEVLDRFNSYNPVPAGDKDEAAINLYGLRPASPITAHEICDPAVGNKVAVAINRRNTWVADTGKIQLPARFIRLEPMDLITITEPNLGLAKTPVRITGVEEVAPDQLEIAFEEFPFGTATATLYPAQVAGGYAPNFAADPGSVNAPIMLEANDYLSITGQYELWLGICGSNPEWGGCTVWVADDDGSGHALTFRAVDRLYGAARMGVLTANLASATGLDNTNTLSVDLTQSFGTLLGGTASDRDNLRTMCAIINSDGTAELISYQNATLTATNKYNLTSLQRGALGSPAGAHVVGDKFIRLDQAVFNYPFLSTDVGKTMHLKFTSFNKTQMMEQALANVADYTYVIGGHYYNFDQIVSNDAAVEAVGTPAGGPFTAATVYVHQKPAGAAYYSNGITLTKSDGTTRSVAAHNYTGQALSTTFYAMYDPASQTHYLLTAYATMLLRCKYGHVCLGAVATPDAGGSGGFTGGGGGFGGGGCPEISMEIAPGVSVGSLRVGSLLDCVNYATGAITAQPILALASKQAEVFEILMEGGAVIRVSWDTPFTQMNGRTKLARDMADGLAAVDRGPGTPWRWEAVRGIRSLGVMNVMAINLGGESFACGVSGTLRTYSHNMAKPNIN